MFKKATLAVLVACLSTAQALIEHGFTHEQLAGIRSKLEPEARASWESGTAMQALIEIDHPEQSVFGKCPFPILPIDDRTTDLFKIAGRVVDGKPANILAFMVDGAAADPAANGVGVLVAGASHPETDKYIEAARDQLIYITEVAPKSELGLISHRSEEVQAWADYISMVPTFLAYWGAIHPGTEDEYKYLYEAYNQIRLYRDVLRDPESGLWHHVLLGGWSDAGLWATGQGWAAHGMLRVHQTIAKSSIKDSFESELQDLVNWAEEIVGATWARQHPEGYLTNYLDYGRESFPELSATALMAATTYRLAMITNATAHIENADRAFALIKTKISENGWLVDVVDPYGFTVAADPPQSPEGNSFCLMLQAAFRDYQAFYNGINNSLGNAFSSLAKAVSLSKIVARDTK